MVHEKKKNPTSLTIRNMQIKTIMRFNTIKIFNYDENLSLISLALFISRKKYLKIKEFLDSIVLGWFRFEFLV